MEIIELLRNFWIWIIGGFGGISIIGIAILIFRTAISNIINKVIGKLAFKQFYDEVKQKSIDDLKEITFSQSLEPIAKSELEKINEKADERLNKEVQKLQKQYENILNVIKIFASYFDDSFMISNEKKEELKVLIENSKKQKQERIQEIKLETKEVKINNQEKSHQEEVKEEIKNNIIR